MRRSVIFFLSLFFSVSAYAQPSLIDSLAANIDSLIVKGRSLKGFIVPELSDTGTTRLHNVYYMDITNCSFQKAVYDRTFSGTETVDFYYWKNELIKAKVYHEKNGEVYCGSFYFCKGAVTAQSGQEKAPSFVKWTIPSLLQQAGEYLKYSSGICNYILQQRTPF
jgi:hypothetical protein